MSELSGTAAVGIETVEWLDGGSGNLIVRVTGRWRRRRPASTAQVTLVIESEGHRLRFPAMPEPPSLGGAGPGMWRLSFSVPGSLAPALGGHIWLALGTVTVPLPAPGAGEHSAGLPAPAAGDHSMGLPAPAAGEHSVGLPAPGAGDHVSAETRSGEPAPIEPARPPDEPPRTDPVEELERQLATTRSDRERLAASLAEGERTRRIAEQRAHAEQALRSDLARQLAAREREAERAREAMGELAAAEDRIRMLERQLRDARRREDEAEQQAATALARARPRPAAEPPPSPAPRSVAPPAPDPEAARLRFEQRLRARLAMTGARVPAEPRLPVVAPSAPTAAEMIAPPAPTAAEMIAPPAPPVPESALVDTLRRELDARAAGEAALRSRLVASETRLAARVLLDQRTAETLRQLRTELEGLRDALVSERGRREAAESHAAELEAERGARLEAERRARADAERRARELERELGGQRERSRDAYDAIGELRGALERLATPPPPDVQPPPAAAVIGSSVAPGPVRPERLSDALARLRESVPAPDAVPETTSAVSITPGGRTLEAAFRRLVKRDADAAGELLLDLLVLQRAAYPHPIAYDLVLGPGRGCVRVTVGEGAPSIERQGAARTREEVDFSVRGEPARIARLLTAHGIWRRVGPRVARVRGRRGLAALEALLSLPLDLVALGDAGATLRSEALLGLVAGMVDPAWTAGERFVIALRDPDGRATYLGVRDGRPLQVIRTAPAGRVATTIDGPPDVLVAVLSGAAVPGGHVSGDVGPLESLRTWIKHAQSA